MHFYWINGMRAFSLILIIVLSSIKHHTAAEMKFYSGDYGKSNNQQQTYEINEANRMWKNLQENWRKGNENVMDNYHTQNMIPSYYGNSDANAQKHSSINNYKSNGDLTTVDKRLWKIFNEQGTGKRQGQSSWNNVRNGGWGKREGNWNNLRGLWGKRSGSSWDKLQGSWGKK
ncbi:hypothetical protein ACKWTF_012043 [Chironomus riparius]